MLLTGDYLSLSSRVCFVRIRELNFNSALNLHRRRAGGRCCKASLITDSDSFEVGRLIGSYGFMNITSFSGLQSGTDMEYIPGDIGRLRAQDVGEGSVKIRLYEGRIAQGSLRGTPVVFKVYPGQQVGGFEADLMAANELSAHASLQSNSKFIACPNIQVLIGCFETKTGEQWLAFKNDGKYTAAGYAQVASEKMSKYGDVGDLAFSVDIRFSELNGNSNALSEGLWQRASAAGAFTPMEKRAFGIADDIYEAGLLFAYVAFIPFCEAGVMDSLSLRRLIENTFQLDVQAMRE